MSREKKQRDRLLPNCLHPTAVMNGIKGEDNTDSHTYIHISIYILYIV